MNQSGTVADAIRQLLTRVFALIVGAAVIIGVSLYLFMDYAAVVNEAGIVRGGSQRVVKQVLAGADADKTTAAVEGVLGKLDGRIFFGSFSEKRTNAATYWTSEVKPAMQAYRETGDARALLEASETYFAKTNEMVDAAQGVFNVMAIVLYIVLLVFVALSGLILKSIYQMFLTRVVAPLETLQGRMQQLSKGNLSQKADAGDAGRFGAIYHLIDETSKVLLGYVRDIEKNLGTMAQGDFVTASDMEYVGDYRKIRENIQHIRATLSAEMQRLGTFATDVAGSADTIAEISSRLKGGAKSQTESIKALQAKLQAVMAETEKAKADVDEANAFRRKTNASIEESKGRMEDAVAAMREISESSAEIRAILVSINEITHQTALLSLNASIEAARAGESGRGFAVVAEEVRKLAEASEASTQHIDELINRTAEKIESGSGVMRTAAESLLGITENTEAMSGAVAKISARSREQQEHMAEVSRLSDDVLRVTETNATVSEECAKASGTLSACSDSLRESIGKFRTQR